MNCKINNIVNGEIVCIKPYGLFIDCKNFTGFCHISNISSKYVNIDKDFKLGDKVKAKIIIIDETTNKINLSIKDCEEIEDKSILKPIKHKKIQQSIKSNELSFEEMMKQYINSSDERLNSINRRIKKHQKS